MAKCICCEIEIADNKNVCEPCDKAWTESLEFIEKPYSYYYTNSNGEKVWTEDYEQSIGE
jgi:hypothetical protein